MVLGRRIPKGTVLLGITATGWEDTSTPVYAGDSADDEDTVARSQRLQGVRTDKTARKYGFWEAGTGRRFMPERWLDEAGLFDPNAGPSLPFSTGQRACFGKNLAVSSTPSHPLDPNRSVLPAPCFLPSYYRRLNFFSDPPLTHWSDVGTPCVRHTAHSRNLLCTRDRGSKLFRQLRDGDESSEAIHHPALQLGLAHGECDRECDCDGEHARSRRMTACPWRSERGLIRRLCVAPRLISGIYVRLCACFLCADR